MRLWYQSFAKLPAFGGYPEALFSTIERARDKGTEVHVQGTTQQMGLVDHEFRSVEFHDTAEVIGNAVRAQAQGYDAFLIGNIADPGLFEIREMLDIPVLGLCETALHVASMMGRGIGLVTINEKFTPRILENVQRYRLEQQLVAVEKMDVRSIPSLGAAFVDPAKGELLETAFLKAAARCVKRGAEVVVAAGGVVMIFLGARGVNSVDGAPILNGSMLLVKMGELAVKMQSLTGTFISKRMTYAGPSPEALGTLRRIYAPEITSGP